MMKEQLIDRIKSFLGLSKDVDELLLNSAIKNYQLRTKLVPTGLLDNNTINSFKQKLNITNDDNNDKKTVLDEKNIIINKNELQGSNIMADLDLTTDLSERTTKDNNIVNYMLPKTEYVTAEGTKMPKEYIFIHHTAGWDNPFNTVDIWSKDKLGRIATHFVIGGINIKTNNNKYDGTIVQCIPDQYWAYHLGGSPINAYMHRHSIGIELCNFGALTLKNEKFYTYANTIVPDNQVVKLTKSFRGYQYWHKYTDRQINSLKYLLKKLSTQYNINLNLGLKKRLQTLDEVTAFEYFNDAVNGKTKGILSHTSVRKDKLDVSPQPNLINMIKNL